MITVREVKTKKEQKEFISFPIKLYAKCPYFVPCLYMDEKQLFKKDYFYYQTCEAVYFNAYKDGKMVGRIQGILQKAANEKWNQKRVRFGRFDFIDDIEVSKALLDAVASWGKSIGMNEMVGPMNFSDMEREGLLVDGYEEMSTFEENYAYPYYKEHLEKLGFKVEARWTESILKAPKEHDDKIKQIADHLMKRYNLHFVKEKSTNKILNKYGKAFFDIVEESYNHIYGSVPFLDAQIKSMIDSFKLILSKRYLHLLLDENEEIVAFALAFPRVGEAIKKSNGHLTPAALFRLLPIIRHSRYLDLGLIGVKKKYLDSGVAWIILSMLMEQLESGEIISVDTNLNLEDNLAMTNNWNRFDRKIVKKYATFVREI